MGRSGGELKGIQSQLQLPQTRIRSPLERFIQLGYLHHRSSINPLSGRRSPFCGPLNATVDRIHLILGQGAKTTHRIAHISGKFEVGVGLDPCPSFGVCGLKRIDPNLLQFGPAISSIGPVLGAGFGGGLEGLAASTVTGEATGREITPDKTTGTATLFAGLGVGGQNLLGVVAGRGNRLSGLFRVNDGIEQTGQRVGFESDSHGMPPVLNKSIIRQNFVPVNPYLKGDGTLNGTPNGTPNGITNGILNGKGGCPGAYFNDNVKSFAKFAPHIGEDLLSSDYIILPYGEFVRRKMTNRFIKPLSGLKEFTGQVANWDDKLSHLHIEPETLCVIASPKEIQAEFRYIIAERRVVTGSEYRWDDVLDVRRDTLPECDALAAKIAAAPWQADIVYVCDIAMTNEGPKVIELNAFSSSGLYACDTYKIVEAVGRAAMKEFNGEIGVGE